MDVSNVKIKSWTNAMPVKGFIERFMLKLVFNLVERTSFGEKCFAFT